MITTTTNTRILRTLLVLFLLPMVMSCGKNDDEPTTDPITVIPPVIGSDVPAVYKKIYGASQIYIEGNFVVIKSNGRPDHKSPYYLNTEWQATMNETYNGTNTAFTKNPNKIGNQNYTFKIPLNPAVNVAHAATPLGAMGVAINGVPLYNQYAAPNQPLTSEINSFDQYYGHPDAGSRYHYHSEPFYLTTKVGKDGLMGFLMDGFPVYGPWDNGAPVVTSTLDAYHGHTHTTADYPTGAGIYHYHTTLDAPYINGSGYYGTPGTISN